METTPTPASVIYDFLMIIDAKTIMDIYKTPSTDPNSPTVIQEADKVLFLLTTKGNTMGGQGQNIDFKARLSDVVRWRETTLSRNTGYNVQLYDVLLTSKKDLFTSPSSSSFTFKIPVPNPSDPLNPKEYQEITDCCWSATICDAGQASYEVYFAVRNRSGVVKGYFKCNFQVKITQLK